MTLTIYFNQFICHLPVGFVCLAGIVELISIFLRVFFFQLQDNHRGDSRPDVSSN